MHFFLFYKILSFFLNLQYFLFFFKRSGALPLPFYPTPFKTLRFLKISKWLIYKLFSFSCSLLPNGIVTAFALTMLIGRPQTARKLVFFCKFFIYLFYSSSVAFTLIPEFRETTGRIPE